jgi:hypothetical protein
VKATKRRVFDEHVEETEPVAWSDARNLPEILPSVDKKPGKDVDVMAIMMVSSPNERAYP